MTVPGTSGGLDSTCQSRLERTRGDGQNGQVRRLVLANGRSDGHSASSSDCRLRHRHGAGPRPVVPLGIEGACIDARTRSERQGRPERPQPARLPPGVWPGRRVRRTDRSGRDRIGRGEGPKVLSGDVEISLKVNGQERKCTIEPRCTLLDTLRNRLDVTGPKRVCDRASCGACTVIIDGEPVYSCTTLAITCQGQDIQTLESFDEKGVPTAFHQHDGLMCGYCTPGFVTACKALLDKNPNPSLEDVKRGLDGNICRCGTYMGVFEAALAAAKAMKGA